MRLSIDSKDDAITSEAIVVRLLWLECVHADVQLSASNREQAGNRKGLLQIISPLTFKARDQSPSIGCEAARMPSIASPAFKQSYRQGKLRQALIYPAKKPAARRHDV